MLGFKRVKANIRSECYFCVFRHYLFLNRNCIKCHFVFIYNSQQTFILWRLFSHFDRQKAKCSVYWIQVRNLQCSFLICALIGSLGYLPFFSLADVTSWFWCYDIQSKSALKRSLFPVCSENEMVPNYLTKRKQ